MHWLCGHCSHIPNYLRFVLPVLKFLLGHRAASRPLFYFCFPYVLAQSRPTQLCSRCREASRNLSTYSMAHVIAFADSFIVEHL